MNFNGSSDAALSPSVCLAPSTQLYPSPSLSVSLLSAFFLVFFLFFLTLNSALVSAARLRSAIINRKMRQPSGAVEVECGWRWGSILNEQLVMPFSLLITSTLKMLVTNNNSSKSNGKVGIAAL